MMDDQIPFYGSQNQRLFAIERTSMDRQGKVIDFLNNHLPEGLVLDIGAGDGYTAKRITAAEVICLEPSTEIANFANNKIWTRGSAEHMPFHDNYFDGAYSTWAYFLPGIDKSRGLVEAERVVKGRGTLIVIGNAGGDEFCSLAPKPISEGPEFYLENGFSMSYIETTFEFESLDDAFALMSLYFGNRITKANIKLEYEYRVAAYTKKLPYRRLRTDDEDGAA